VTERILYLDSSAIVKLVIPEAESDALVAYLAPDDVTFTSRIAAIEVRRAVARRGGVDIIRVEDVLGRLRYRDLDDDVVVRASGLGPAELRTLDAIHFASALDLRGQLAAFVTYDERQAVAARHHGLAVASPGS
jgi:uncharacterized protein